MKAKQVQSAKAAWRNARHDCPPAGLHYEHVTGDEEQRTRALWEAVFVQDSKAFLDYYYRYKIPRAQIHVLRDEDGGIVSMVHLNPYEVINHGVQKKAYYTVGVATMPKYRRGGCMTYLLRQALAQAEREECAFVFLMPADPAIYEPFGFRYGYRHRLWERSGELIRLMDQAKNMNRDTGAGGQPRMGAADTGRFIVTAYDSVKDQGGLAAFAAKKLAERYDTYCVHDGDYFDRLNRELCSENGALYLIWKKNAQGVRLCGYFGYSCEDEEYLQEVVAEEGAERLFQETGSEERMMFLPFEAGAAYGRTYFPEIV